MFLRCHGRIQGELLEEDGKFFLEVKCRSIACGAQSGVVVLHKFDLSTGDFTTKKFRDPQYQDKQEGAVA